MAAKRTKHPPAKLPDVEPLEPKSIRKMIISLFAITGLLTAFMFVLLYLYTLTQTEDPTTSRLGAGFTQFVQDVFRIWIDSHSGT